MSQPTYFTNVESVKITAPQLTEDIDDEVITQLITDAHTTVIGDFPARIIVQGVDLASDILEQAERYLTLHFASMDSNSANRGVQTEQVSVLKTTYFKPDYTVDWFSTSTWGNRYWALWKQYGKGGNFNFALIQH